MRAAIAALPPRRRALEEEVVNAAIMGTPEWAAARTVLLYHHKGPEFSVSSLANAAWRAGKRVVFPRVVGPGALALHVVAGWEGLVPGAFGLREPGPGALQVVPAEVELAIVPGIAFTRDGDRLGQAGGYYDRLLPQLGGPAWGVCFDCQIVAAVPLEGHDQRVIRVWSAEALLTDT
jgi:5-formyltetrahydrofolate cyclo-ligase